MKRLIYFGIVILSLFLLSGCTSSVMQKSSIDSSVLPTVKPEHAQIVFMRPSTFGGAIQSSVFDLKDGENKSSADGFVGIVSSTTKISYEAEPGFHLFMVVGESADFMRANLKAGKTYYALVTPRMGWWKARFSLKPLHSNDLKSGDFQDWFKSTDWYENTSASRQWAIDNWDSITSKKVEDLEEWNKKSDSEKADLTLMESDCR